MSCCKCGRNTAGLPVMRDNVTGLECCESCGRALGGPQGFIEYVESLHRKSAIGISIKDRDSHPKKEKMSRRDKLIIIACIIGVVLLFSTINWMVINSQNEYKRTHLVGYSDAMSLGELLAVTCDNKVLISYTSNRNDILRWDINSGKQLLPEFYPDNPPIDKFITTPDSKKMILTYWGRNESDCPDCEDYHTIEVVDIRSLKTKYLKGHQDIVEAFAVTPDSKRLVSASKDGTIKIWDLQVGTELMTLKDPAINIAITPDGKNLISISEKNQTLVKWDINSGRKLMSYKVIPFSGPLLITPDGKRVIFGGGDFGSRGIIILDIESGKRLMTLSEHYASTVCDFTISLNGKRLATNYHVWDLVSGQEIMSFESEHFAITPDGKWLFAGLGRYQLKSEEMLIKIWDVDSNREIRSLKGFNCYSFTITPDGKRLVTWIEKDAGYDNTIVNWDINKLVY
jgi:WD40 repeat protein